MKRIKFEKVTDGVYYLPVPYENHFVGITLVKGDSPNNTVIIDTGASSKSITEYLLPALKSEGISTKDVGYATFTHCHPDNIGGMHTLRKEMPHVQIVAPRGFADTLRNPMASILQARALFPMQNPPFHEIMGIFPNRELTAEEEVGARDFAGLRAIRAAGHSDCICWYHASSETIICGDALQGNGNSFQGMPFYVSVSRYRTTLKNLSQIKAEHTVCTRSMDGVEYIDHGDANYKKTIKRCEECISDTGKAIKALLDKGVTDVEIIARELTSKNFGVVPEALTYAMQTVSAHISERIFE